MHDLIPQEARKYIYYEEDNIILLHGDCTQIMPLLEPVSVDLIFTDPPYGITSLEWDKWPSAWIHIAKLLLKEHGSLWCFGSLKMFMQNAMDFNGWTPAQDIIWEKHNGSNFHNDRFRRVHEIIAHFYPDEIQWKDIYHSNQYTPDALAKTVRRQKRPAHMRPIEGFEYISENGGPRLMRSVFKSPSCHGYAVHPTQKPLDVLMPIIEYSGKPEGIILDPFGGSCSIARAAKKLGRKCISIEINKKYLDEAVELLKQGELLNA